MFIQENKDMVSVHYDSILNLIEEDFKGHKNESQITKFTKSDDYCDIRKYGKTNKSFKDVIRHSLIGDPVLLENLKSKIEVINKVTGLNTLDYVQKVQKSKRVRNYSDQGDELDIEKVYAGELDTCWTSSYRKEFDSSHKFVTLFIENGENWNVDVVSSFWRSAIAVHLTKELQKAGKSVRLVVGTCTNNSIQKDARCMTTSMTVKEYNQQMNLERVAAMTHLGFFRCVNFAMMYTAPYKLNEGLGRHVPINASRWPIQLKEQMDKGHTRLIHIKPVNNETDAIAALKFAYKQLGVS
ncbi:MAG: hypothetical protein K0U78_15280 [Actinomycetia bacterium]|nr:hypothetical protein [Actinomycetes bacterium]